MVKKKTIFLKILKNKIVRWILAIAILAIAMVVVVRVFFYNDEKEVTSSYLGTELVKVGELTTVKLHYTGIAEYKDTGIAIINKSDFVMRYEADARVGIDLEKVVPDVDNTNKIVWLTIPKAEIQDVNVDSSKIRYYDEQFSLLNWDEKEDGNKAIELAEKKARQDLEQMGVLESADEQALTLIKGLLQQAVPSDYRFKVKEK